MQNRLFLPQSALDHWNVEGMVDVQQDELTVVGAGRRYRLAEAVRVLREVGGKNDEWGLVGRVKTRHDLERRGAEIVETSMLLGEGAYDIEAGWLAVPVGAFSAHGELGGTALPGATADQAVASEAPKSDEDLLLRLLDKTARQP